MSNKTTNLSSTKLIWILVGIAVLFIGSLFLLYNTFGRSNAPSDSVETKTKNSSSSMVGFEDTDTSSSSIQPDNKFDSLGIVSKTSSSSAATNNPNISFNFSQNDIAILNKYIDLDLEAISSKISAKVLNSKGNNGYVLKIPEEKIKSLTQKDFTNTFMLTNENRPVDPKEKLFIYFPAEKLVWFLGDYITDLESFEYEGEDYWLAVYYGSVVLSKPNFSDWRYIESGQYIEINKINKKSNFEFEVNKTFSYEGYDENKTEILSPQKYIIDKIFEEAGED